MTIVGWPVSVNLPTPFAETSPARTTEGHAESNLRRLLTRIGLLLAVAGLLTHLTSIFAGVPTKPGKTW